MTSEQPSSGPIVSGTANDSVAHVRARIPTLILIAAIGAGALMGIHRITNTSIGWHLASGRWILEHRQFVRTDPFSLTSGGAPWLDHEWLFQVVAALVDELGGAPALIALRALVVAVLAVLLLMIGHRSGLSPPVALLLSLLSVAAARPRFFVRPELVTLLVVPACVWLYVTRRDRPVGASAGGLAALMVVGANAHGGALIVPFLLGGIFAAETADMMRARTWDRHTVASGVAGFAVAATAALLNPYGWHLYTAPFKLASLIGQPHINNPEWFTPTPSQVPALFAALAAGLLVMAWRERRLAQWALFIMAAALALRHVRNLGIFFALLPPAVAPALATWTALTDRADAFSAHRRRVNILAVLAAAVLAVSVSISPQPGFGFGYAEEYYPSAACDFLDREGLPHTELYNDVRFGGYLIDRYWPLRKVFQDDRNEIHEPLLREIWNIFQASDARAFTGLLERYDCDTALVRYHPPLRVMTPDGRTIGTRGFSALWFPGDEWALVYWDDIAMVFVRRTNADPELLERHEYHVLRPDDLEELSRRVASSEATRAEAGRELERALRSSPESWRAHQIQRLFR